MVSFYYNTVCFVCRKPSSMLKQCANCKLISYCSVTHQKNHWKEHKQFCKVIQTLLTQTNKTHIYENLESLSRKEFDSFRLQLRYHWENQLQRPLNVCENQLWMYPRLCKICRNTNQADLIDCKRCNYVSACKHHNLNQLHTQYECNKFLYGIKLEQTIPSVLKLEHIKIPDLKLSDMTRFSKGVNQEFIDQFILEDCFSFALTTLYTLEKLSLLKTRVMVTEELRINFVGAEEIESNLNWEIEIGLLFEWIQNIDKIIINCIGPELSKTDTVEIVYGGRKKAFIYFHPELYHNYVTEYDKKANLNILFNCGFHECEENNPWESTIPLLTDIPVAFTSYTQEEHNLDLEVFHNFKQSDKLETVMSGKNPFASLRPIRDWSILDKVFFVNQYLTIIKP